MSQSIDTSGYDTDAFDRGTDPVLSILTSDQARRLVQYRGDEALRNRIDELAEKSNEGLLSPAEQAEYEGYVRANKFIAILQAKAQRLLSRGAK
jgi:hypothetical protein